MELQRKPYGATPQGVEIEEYTIRNSRGLEIRAITWGGILTSVRQADRRGQARNVTLGFDTLDGYLANPPYFGAIIGRFANRIAGGRFTLDGKEYRLACNDGPHHLHGGRRGFDKVVWRAESFEEPGTPAGGPAAGGPAAGRRAAAGVRFTYRSPDGEEGYPGNLEAEVTYTLSEADELAFEYRATTDQPTPVSLTNHAYWNLAGAGSGTILDHELTLDCPFYLPVDDELQPTGEVRELADGPFDFHRPKPIGRDIGQVPHGPALPPGYDHCYGFAAGGSYEPALRRVARVYEPGSGRGMEVFTTLPGVQLYTGNFLKGERGAGGALYPRHGALCLETQFYPDSPNRPQFPSCILRPGEVWRHRTVHRFFAE